MRILLIHAWNARERSYRGFFSSMIAYRSMTLASLVALVPEDINATVDICDEMSQKINYDGIKYDLVGISFDTSSSLRAYEHAEAFRKRGAYIVCGGYHTSNLPDEVALHTDTIILGAAEGSFPQFLRDFKEGTPKKRYCQAYNAADIPIPARAAISKKKYVKYPSIIADRGCVNRCKFCSIAKMWRSNPRPVQSVIDEIIGLKAKSFIFYDPNFFAPKAYAIELMNALAKLNIKWVTNATAEVAFDDELLELAKKSGCKGVLIGLESISEESLKGVDKRFSKVEQYKEVVERFHAYNIAVNGCFVLGFDGDTEESLLSIPEKVRYLKLDLTRFAILTPTPGSQLYKEMDEAGRIITKDWSKYSQHCAVFSPKHMSPERLEEIYHETWKKTYSFRNIAYRFFHLGSKDLQVRLVLLTTNLGFKFLNI